VTTQDQVLDILDRTLQLGGRTAGMGRNTPLLGSLPELDSMAVAWIVAALEEELEIVIEDDEVSAEIFATVGSLVDFVAAKLPPTGPPPELN